MRSLLARLILPALLLAACAGADGTTPVTPPPPPPPPPAPAPVASVTVSGSTDPLIPGQTRQLGATSRDAQNGILTGRTVTWSVAPTGIATVGTGGLVTAVAPGQVTVTASTEGVSGSLALTVNPAPPAAVASVTLTTPKVAFVAGESATWTATPRDAQGNALTGRTITWNSSVPTVASVSASGAITTLAAGTTTISATSEGISASSGITVTPNNTASLMDQRIVTQQGLAIALASTVLQSQLMTLLAAMGFDVEECTALPGGGSFRRLTAEDVIPMRVEFYFDNACARAYMKETVTTYTESAGGHFHLIASADYFGPTGTALGRIAFDEFADDIHIGSGGQIQGTVHGLGIYTPPGGGTTVRLGLNCDFLAQGHNVGVCQGGIAQDFPALNTSLGSVATLALDSTSAGVLNFTGGSSLSSGLIGALGLSQPSATSMLVTGGSAYSSGAAGGTAATFSLFPPMPTGWSVTDTAHDMIFTISLLDNTTRTLAATVKRISSGATLATLSLDQSGTGTITYSDGLTAVVRSWMLSQ